MVKYYYDKYTSIVKKTPIWHELSTTYASFYDLRLYKGYTNSSPSVWGLINPFVPEDFVDINTAGYRVTANGQQLEKFTAKSAGYANTHIEATVQYALINEAYNTYSRGSLVQSNIIAENGTYPDNGTHTDGYWYVKKGLADNPPTTPSTISVAGSFKTGETVTVSWGASMDPDGDVITYGLEVSINGGNYTQIYSGANRNFSYTIPNGTTKLAFRVRAYANGAYSGYQTSPTYNVKSNSLPIVTLNIENNLTLYENDTLTIAGSAYDSDADQSVTVYYQINDSQRKVLATNLSQTTITFNKQLKFSGGVLYDGDTAVSSALTDGVAYTLKVWAVDSDGAQSEVQTRTFYVVPNRAPTLTLDEVVPSGIIDSDKFTISGQAGDPDANANIKVSYRINNNNSVEVYNGPGDAFSFDVMLGQLNVGQNTITIEAADNYGAKYTKTIKLNKKEVKTPLLQSTARYKIEPPSGSAKGVLLWIQRHKNLQIDIKINMTLKGEPENFVSMSLENTAPVDNDIVEDEFFYEVDDSVDNIILQIDMTRSSIDVDDSIKLISGVLE
ncbi:hypothetical protein [Ureibacillus thermophilus]|uniref:Fibronectin type-III domain-containing protein n=1 Tax=Ureibacillus thermophilus TaxID=367743 RepID=A0A4P6UWU0_9BACL|nr:hypothetical protein [Ureibacillus thermophilus]QBK26756.1 hypothetical protein DKZ56_13395 [Ureibacillus thermophilus]